MSVFHTEAQDSSLRDDRPIKGTKLLAKPLPDQDGNSTNASVSPLTHHPMPVSFFFFWRKNTSELLVAAMSLLQQAYVKPFEEVPQDIGFGSHPLLNSLCQGPAVPCANTEANGGDRRKGCMGSAKHMAPSWMQKQRSQCPQHFSPAPKALQVPWRKESSAAEPSGPQ